MTRGALAFIAVLFLAVPGRVDASSDINYQSLEALLTLHKAPHHQSLTLRDGAVIRMACDSGALDQCNSDCAAERLLCETGHDDGLPCEPNYSTCLLNCQDIAGCN